MFSAVVFHDEARKRGINPILGCEVYVAPGDRRDKSGTPGETANHLVLLAENAAGFKNLIALVSSGYTDGFYYKPRIDKALLAQHSEGLIGLSSCLKGEVASEIRTEHAKRATAAAAAYRDILGAGNFFLEMQYQGIEEQRDRQHRPAADRARSRAAARVHQRRALPAPARLEAARPAALHRHGQDGARREAPEVPRRSVLPQDRRADGRGVRRLSRGHAQHARHRRALQRHDSVGDPAPAEVRGARGLHARRLLRARVARRASPSACRASGSSPPTASCATTSTSTRRGSTTRSR